MEKRRQRIKNFRLRWSGINKNIEATSTGWRDDFARLIFLSPMSQDMNNEAINAVQ